MKRVEDRMVSGVFAGLSKQEKITLVVLAVASLGAAYLIWELFLAPRGLSSGARDIVSMLYAVLILGVGGIQQYTNGPLEDERERQVTAKGTAAGYFTLVFLLVVTGIVVRQNSFAGYLGSRTQSWLEMYLLLCVAVSLAVNYAIRAYGFWRDRRAVSE